MKFLVKHWTAKTRGMFESEDLQYCLDFLRQKANIIEISVKNLQNGKTIGDADLLQIVRSNDLDGAKELLGVQDTKFVSWPKT